MGAFLGGIIGPKTVDAIGWVITALLLIAAAFFLGRCDGIHSEKEAQEAARVKENAKTLERDAAAKERAATERATDTATIAEKQRNQVDAIKGDDDAAIRRNSACQRLRAAGRSEAALPAACRAGG